jgi:hypothetical protein
MHDWQKAQHGARGVQLYNLGYIQDDSTLLLACMLGVLLLFHIQAITLFVLLGLCILLGTPRATLTERGCYTFYRGAMTQT